MFSTKGLAIMILVMTVLFLALIGLQYAELRHYNARPAAVTGP